MIGIAIFDIGIIMILLSILILLCVKVSKNIDIITISSLLYIVIRVVAFNTNDITVLLLSMFITVKIGRINIINIIIKKSGINKIIILLLIYINIIMSWLFMLIIEIEIGIIMFNIGNIMILLSILL